MKIAFILLCHKNSTQINKLIDKLNCFDSEIFIHCDLKNYDITNSILKLNNIHILTREDSFNVRWGGTEMILATLSLLKNVKQYSDDNKIKFDYIWLLSGQDYLIQNPKYVIDRLNLDKTINYMNITPLNSIKYKEYLKRCETKYYNVGWLTQNKTFIKVIKRIYMLLTGGSTNTYNFLKRKKPFDGTYYFGSQWWTITDDCARFILEYCEKNTNYLKFFMNTLVPDECFFQTIVMNSKYKDYIKENLTYVNWGDNNRSPDLIVTKDYGNLIKKSENYFFARKFDYNVDKTIFEKIDATIKN